MLSFKKKQRLCVKLVTFLMVVELYLIQSDFIVHTDTK